MSNSLLTALKKLNFMLQGNKDMYTSKYVHGRNRVQSNIKHNLFIYENSPILALVNKIATEDLDEEYAWNVAIDGIVFTIHMIPTDDRLSLIPLPEAIANA